MFIQKVKHLHFVGIGGSGMCGIAEVLLNMGFHVSGSDLVPTAVTRRLQVLGGTVFIGHEPGHISDAQVVVTSSAVRPGNPEVAEARRRKIPVIPRAEMLAELMRMKRAVAVAGAHGKTTVTAMAASVLAAAGLDPTAVIGGRLDAFGSNARLGQGDFLVAEADESDGSFLHLLPTWAVITNIDREHLDFYGDLDGVRRAFAAFAEKVPFYGAVIAGADSPPVRELLPEISKRTVTFGLAETADVRAEEVTYSGFGSACTVRAGGAELGRLVLALPGEHNVQNALAALALALELDLPPGKILAALAAFRNASRRFELKGECGGLTVVDDYGHHPSEIRATLRAARAAGKNRVVAAFQPHRYTRTRDLAEDFAGAFEDADVLVVTDIYAAGEDPIDGVDGAGLFGRISASARPECHWVPRREDVAGRLVEIVRPGDLVVTLGAGDIWKAGEELCRFLEGEKRK